MLNIVWAEFIYYKNVVLFYVILLVASFLTIWYGVRIEANQVPSQMLILLVTVFSLGNIQSGWFIKSKRMRLFNAISLSRKLFGDLRFLFPFVTWAGALLILGGLYTLVSIFDADLTHPSFNQLLLLNGIILITQSVYLFNIDVRHLSHTRSLHIVAGIVYGVTFLGVLFPFYVLVNFAGLFEHSETFQNWLNELMQSSKAAWSFNVVGYIFYRASYYIYGRRKQYLE